MWTIRYDEQFTHRSSRLGGLQAEALPISPPSARGAPQEARHDRLNQINALASASSDCGTGVAFRECLITCR
jgi:hypothetical protein